MFRLESDQAVINRYGFNSEGHDPVIRRLKERIKNYMFRNPRLVVSERGEIVNTCGSTTKSLYPLRMLGINLGKNKQSLENVDSDYVDGVRVFGEFADYLVINVSSPNTPGLRDLQGEAPIRRLLGAARIAVDELKGAVKPRLVVKISPDLTPKELEGIADVCIDIGFDGVILGNTTTSREGLTSANQVETGGMSGKPLFEKSLRNIGIFSKRIHERGVQDKIVVIGCGGVSSGEDALRMCRAGASVVQLYTALGYKGPGIVGEIKREIIKLLKKDGKNWMASIGSDLK